MWCCLLALAAACFGDLACPEAHQALEPSAGSLARFLTSTGLAVSTAHVNESVATLAPVLHSACSWPSMISTPCLQPVKHKPLLVPVLVMECHVYLPAAGEAECQISARGGYPRRGAGHVSGEPFQGGDHQWAAPRCSHLALQVYSSYSVTLCMPRAEGKVSREAHDAEPSVCSGNHVGCLSLKVDTCVPCGVY